MPVPTAPGALSAAFRVVCIRCTRRMVGHPDHRCSFEAAASSKCAYCTSQKGACTPVSTNFTCNWSEADMMLAPVVCWHRVRGIGFGHHCGGRRGSHGCCSGTGPGLAVGVCGHAKRHQWSLVGCPGGDSGSPGGDPGSSRGLGGRFGGPDRGSESKKLSCLGLGTIANLASVWLRPWRDWSRRSGRGWFG